MHLPLTSSHDPTTFFLKLAVRNLVSKEEEITGIITIYFGRRTLPKLANFLQENLMPFFTNYHSFFTTFSIFYFSRVLKNKKVSTRAKYNIVQSAGSAFYVFSTFPITYWYKKYIIICNLLGLDLHPVHLNYTYRYTNSSYDSINMTI